MPAEIGRSERFLPYAEAMTGAGRPSMAGRGHRAIAAVVVAACALALASCTPTDPGDGSGRRGATTRFDCERVGERFLQRIRGRVENATRVRRASAIHYDERVWLVGVPYRRRVMVFATNVNPRRGGQGQIVSANAWATSHAGGPTYEDPPALLDATIDDAAVGQAAACAR
jgi:hypothetical protein